MLVGIREWREHRWAWRRISDYVDGELRPVDRRRLERHAVGCEECGPLLRSLLALIDALRATGSGAPATVVPGVLRRLRAQPHRSGDGPSGGFAT